MAFCINCGKHLPDGAKFCFECGAKVNLQAVECVEKRETVYEGELHKCPNCGELVDAFKLNCPSCGYEFRGLKAKSAVRELAEKLEEIEKKKPAKKERTFKDDFVNTYGHFSTADEQVISLIKSFSIPNTKEDIFEFVILASSNIDVNLYGSEKDVDKTGAQRAISDAWLSKFEQAYQKAQLMFSEAQGFCYIENLHMQKMAEIKCIQRQAKRKSALLSVEILFWLAVNLLLFWVISRFIINN